MIFFLVQYRQGSVQVSGKFIGEMFYNKPVLFAASSFNLMRVNAVLLRIAMQFDKMNNK